MEPRRRSIIGQARLVDQMVTELVAQPETVVVPPDEPIVRSPRGEQYCIEEWQRIAQSSNYPRCCTVYFLSEGLSKKNYDEWPEQVKLAVQLLEQERYQFIPCPGCAGEVIDNLHGYLELHPSIVREDQRTS